MTAEEQTTGPVWRDRGTIIANQQSRIAELEAACQRLRDDYQGALAEREEARAEVERLRDAAVVTPADMDATRNERDAAEADAAGLRARIEALCDDTSRHLVRWIDDSHLVDVSDVRAALAAEPTPAAEPHAEDDADVATVLTGAVWWLADQMRAETGTSTEGWVESARLSYEDGLALRPAPVADPDDTKDGQR